MTKARNFFSNDNGEKFYKTMVGQTQTKQIWGSTIWDFSFKKTHKIKCKIVIIQKDQTNYNALKIFKTYEIPQTALKQKKSIFITHLSTQLCNYYIIFLIAYSVFFYDTNLVISFL